MAAAEYVSWFSYRYRIAESAMVTRISTTEMNAGNVNSMVIFMDKHPLSGTLAARLLFHYTPARP